MTEEQDRLNDLNIEEALGRTTPPDLSPRILQAADQPLEDAPTPISGAHAVPRTVRPKGRRLTAAIPKRNWQGAGIAAAFMLLLAIGLVAFMVWKSPSLNQPTSTAGQPQPTNQSPVRQHRDVPANTEQSPKPQPKPEPEPKPNDSVEQPEPKPDDTIEQPTPDPKPDDTVEQPQPEPKPDDTVEQPEPEPKPDDTVEKPKPDDGTTAEPTPAPVMVASFSAEGHRTFTYFEEHQVRNSDSEDWYPVGSQKTPGVELDEAHGVYWVPEGLQLKFNGDDVAMTNGAQVVIDGEVCLFTHSQGLRVEILKKDIYVDNLHASSTLRVTMGDFEIVFGEGAAVIESTKSKLDVFCVEGEISANGTIIPAGFMTSLTSRGLSNLREASENDWKHSMLNVVPARHLGIEEFEIAPLGKMISGRLETRTAAQLGEETDGHVAVDTGREAAVGFGFDGEHETLRGEMVRVRYRATGAEKLVLQLFCPARNDNFGTDLAPGKEGEWHILEIRLSDLRDRETHKDAPAPGTILSSFTLALDGKSDAQLEIDWVELVREAKFGE